MFQMLKACVVVLVSTLACGRGFTDAAKAAELGGDCCTDLQERVAALEATTVSKRNRKVSLIFSGYVANQVFSWTMVSNATPMSLTLAQPRQRTSGLAARRISGRAGWQAT